MNRYSFYQLIVFSLLVFTGCGKNTQPVKDIIPVYTLEAGIRDTLQVSDLFYADEYNLMFESNENIYVEYDNRNNSLIIIPNKNFAGLSLVSFKQKNEEYVIPVNVIKKKIVKFSFAPLEKYEVLTLFGSFNSWNRHQLYFNDADSDGVYEIDIPLDPGRYEYKFYADGEELIDPANPDSISNGMGGFNSVITVPDNSEKLYLHQISIQKENDKSLFNFFLETENNSFNISNDDVVILLNNKAVGKNQIKVSGNNINVLLDNDLLKDEVDVRAAVNIEDRTSNIQTIKLYNGEPAGYDSKNFSWYDGIIYSLMIDRFNDGDSSLNAPIDHDSLMKKANYMGGDFQGIINKINNGYFDSLGINIIWISPVYDNPNKAYKEYPEPHRWFSGYHGYWPVNSEGVEEQFGTFDQLKELINSAHQHDIKILLDFVSNHVQELNPLFIEHRDWFGELELPDGRLNLRFWDEFRLTTWFEPYLPSFDYQESTDALNYMTDNAIWWLEETGADGYRHDAVKHVPNKFWRALTSKIKQHFRNSRDLNVYQIGETFGDYNLVSSYVNPGQLNAQFNFELYNTAQAVFLDTNRSFTDLDKEMHKTFDVYGYLHLMGNIMDSHDKNRYMAYADGDLDLTQSDAVEIGWNNPPKVDDPSSYKKAELYLAYMNSIPGLPVIYYGSEFGMTGASDPDNRRMMRFGEQLNEYEKDMLDQTCSIINIRNENPVLRYGDFYVLNVDDDVYVFVRSDFNERVVVILNKSSKQKEINITLPYFYSYSSIKNLYDNSTILIKQNAFTDSVSPYGWKIYKLEK